MTSGIGPPGHSGSYTPHRPSKLSSSHAESAHTLKDFPAIPLPSSAVREDDESSAARHDAGRATLRTPSPTPSETGMLEGSIWNPTGNRKRQWRDCTSTESLVSTTVTVLIIAVVVVFLVFQQRIIDAMKPWGDWLHRTPGAWLIPIAILFVLSFPPLFGSGLFAIFCGNVWGTWIGFGIVAAGTVLGELGNFFVFKWCCSQRGHKWEEKYLQYALWAQVVREGGFIIPTIMRFTSYPGHVLTAIFSTCGMSIWAFLFSAVLSTPKQLATVYLGAAQGHTKSLAAIQAGIAVGITAITYLALWYVGREIDKVKATVIYGRRKRRQAKALRGGRDEGGISASSSTRGLA